MVLPSNGPANVKFRSRRERKEGAEVLTREEPREGNSKRRRSYETPRESKIIKTSPIVSSLGKYDLLKPTIDKSKQHQEIELRQIREKYLGIKNDTKKIQKPSEKFRNIFTFEWDPSEDTSKGDSNPLYQNRMEPQLLFGRGFRAGIDVREQRKANDFYDKLIRKRALTAEGERCFDEQKERAVRARHGLAEDSRSLAHWSDKPRDEMTDRDWRICREDFEIFIKGGRVPPPMRNWAESGLPKELLDAVVAAGYRSPTPIQRQAIPLALGCRDLIGIAETGSGKTAAFCLPMLAYVKSLPPLTDAMAEDGPYCLVLAPSRELAIQIEAETRKFSAFCRSRVVAVVGGRSAESQAFELRRGAEIVIGTPGRVKECLEKAYTVLNQCNYIVLDEADRMIDLGFEEVVNFILDMIPSSTLKSHDEDEAYRQELEAKAGYRRFRLTQMFSATMPAAVERLTKKYLRAAAYVSIGEPGGGKRSIQQILEFMIEGRKKGRLLDLVERSNPPIMVFVNQKKMVDVVCKNLITNNHSATALHGGKAQDIRESALAAFKSGAVDILVATDVAGRGIDVEGVQLVVNYDMPKDIESYTHRIGRTGRAGLRGHAISFVTEEDSPIFYDLRNLLMATGNNVPPELNAHPASKVKPTTK